MKNITTFDFKELNKFDKIFCLVSGGIDSTYLYEMLLENCQKEKIFPVNCFNPFESNASLDEIKLNPNFIEVKPEQQYDYGKILKESFLRLPIAFQLKKDKKYSKKTAFRCCSIIKHKAFLENELFKQSNTVVISGIKKGDGRQRSLWLKSLFDGITTSKGTLILNAPTFYHKHKGGQLYCYPFRDYKEREINKEIIEELRIKYPKLNHSGCYVCPVMVLFQKRVIKSIKGNEIEEIRFKRSIDFAKKLNVYDENY